MATAKVQNPPLAGNVLFYRQPELLSKEQHGKLGVNASKTRFGFALGSHVCPLTVQEFSAAGTCYPIIFVSKDYNPVAVMGIVEGQNLFASTEKGYETDAYIPAFIRRYPFVLAQPDAGAGQPVPDRMMVGIDRGYEYIAEKAEYPFFTEAGEASDYTQRCIQFCNDFETQIRTTRSFVDLCKELDLFEQRSTTYTPQNPDGTPAGQQPIPAEQRIDVGIDLLDGAIGDQLDQLVLGKRLELVVGDPEVLGDQLLVANGAIQQIYAHINSLFCWDRLLARHFERYQAENPPAANA